MILQPDVAFAQSSLQFRVLIHVHPHDFLAVHRHDDPRTAAYDFHEVPFACGLGHVLLGSDGVVNGSCRIGCRVATVIVKDLDFHAGECWIAFQRGTNENAAVAAFADFEFKPQDEVFILLVRTKPAATFARANKDTVFNLPRWGTHHIPTCQILPVEQGDKTLLCLLRPSCNRSSADH